jgi:DnaA-like protein
MTLHNPELLRQHNDYKAIQARLWGKRKSHAETQPSPVAVVREPAKKLVQLDYHVWLYRMHRIHFPAGLSTSASFEVSANAEYVPYVTEVVFATTPELRKTMKQIALEVLEDFPGISLDVVKGLRRDKAAVKPRHLIMYEIKKQQPWRSYPEIGRFMNRDHTVPIHAINKLKAELDGDEISLAKHERKRQRICDYHSATR